MAGDGIGGAARAVDECDRQSDDHVTADGDRVEIGHSTAAGSPSEVSIGPPDAESVEAIRPRYGVSWGGSGQGLLAVIT